MTEPALLGLNQFKFIKETNTVAKTLYRSTDSSGVLVMEYDAAAYQVPVGKKFIILQSTTIISGTGASYQDIWYFEHTVPNAAGGTEKLHYYTPMVVGDGGALIYKFDVYIEIAAGNYINSNHSSNLVREIMLGIECDA